MSTTTNNPLLDYVIAVKAAYRKTEAAKTWEEKVADVERMQEASRIAKEGMREAMRLRKAAALGISNNAGAPDTLENTSACICSGMRIPRGQS